MLMSLYFSKGSILFMGISLFFLSCTQAPTSEKESVITGKATILVDETFEPIIEDQLLVFESTYKHADISLVNAPENKVFICYYRIRLGSRWCLEC